MTNEIKTSTLAVRYPKIVPKNPEYKVTFNGQSADVFQACNACFASAISDEMIVVEISTTFEMDEKEVCISPLHYGIKPVVTKNSMRFTVSAPLDIVVWCKKRLSENPLMIYTNLPEQKPSGDDVMFFKTGQIYEVGELVLEKGISIYIEEGAVVRGRLRCIDLSSFKIAGRGVWDGSLFKGISHGHTLRFDKCTEFELLDLIVVNPTTWMIVIGDCHNAKIHGIREIGEVVGSDGIDVVGSTDISIDRCAIHNNDDCIAIKSFDRRPTSNINSDIVGFWAGPVKNISITNCLFMNGNAGNSLDIGHELRTESISDIMFENNTVLFVHGHGSAIAIHNGDRAVVENITFRNFIIEHCYDKLFDIRVMKSQFNRDPERGQIRNVRFENVDITYIRENPGYTVSIVSGYDSEHTVDGVVFENCRLNGEPVLSADQLDMSFRHAYNVEFK